MKHKLWVTSLTILSACTLMACSHTTQKDTAASSTKESSSKVEKQTSSSSSKDTSSTKKNTSSQETKRIGNADYGYIDIPSKWYKFTDLSGVEAVQYTDGSAYNIVTLDSFCPIDIRELDPFTWNIDVTIICISNPLGFLTRSVFLCRRSIL